MKVLIQRVREAHVSVAGEIIGRTGPGVVLLVGITHSDTQAQALWLADKVAGLRIFEDDDGKLNRSLTEVAGGVLAVSQFTLYGDARKGRRPSFTAAARPEQAQPLFEFFVAALRAHHLPVETGRFGAEMIVQIANDGPVTLLLER